MYAMHTPYTSAGLIELGIPELARSLLLVRSRPSQPIRPSDSLPTDSRPTFGRWVNSPAGYRGSKSSWPAAHYAWFDLGKWNRWLHLWGTDSIIETAARVSICEWFAGASTAIAACRSGSYCGRSAVGHLRRDVPAEQALHCLLEESAWLSVAPLPYSQTVDGSKLLKRWVIAGIKNGGKKQKTLTVKKRVKQYR